MAPASDTSVRGQPIQLPAMKLQLTPSDQAMIDGERGEAARLAMRIVASMAGSTGAERLIDVTSAHVDGCLYHGQASLDFAGRLVAGGARVAIPTTLNVAERPSFGQHVAWAESNAVVFANSVLGARTDRYGDFIDICAAITGRAPAAGFHLDQNRAGQILFRLDGVSQSLLAQDVLFPVLGHVVGSEAGTLVPVIEGLPGSVTEDQLKALGAAAASSGAVALFHAVGITPEARSVEEAFGGTEPRRVVQVTPSRLAQARDSLSTVGGDRIDAVSVGTPHFSVAEFARLTPLLERAVIASGVDFFVSTSRQVLAEVESRGWLDVYQRAGVKLVVDTCTYVTPILNPSHRVVMTNSAKWAYYAPANVGVDVVFGSLEECVRSAAEGRLRRDEALWRRG